MLRGFALLIGLQACTALQHRPTLPAARIASVPRAVPIAAADAGAWAAQADAAPQSRVPAIRQSKRHRVVSWLKRAARPAPNAFRFAARGVRRLLPPLVPFVLLTPRLAFGKAIGAVSGPAQLSYTLQQALIRNAGISIFAFFVGAVFLGGWLWSRVNPDTNLLESTFKAYSLLNDIPGADACDPDEGWPRLIAVWLHMVGVLTFAVVLAIVSDGIGTKVESLRTSNERVIETRHTVLLNWGEYTQPVLRQLEAARREGRLSGSVVIIADHDKEEMDAAVDEMSPKPGLSVATRSGAPTELSHMLRASAGTARRIIVTPPEAEEQADEYPKALKESAALALSLQESVEPSARDKRAHVVVSKPSGEEGFEHGESEGGGGFASYSEVAPIEFVSRLLAQCTAQPGLSRVYEELLLQGEGNELYATAVPSRLVGKSFVEAAKVFPRATPLGLLTPSGEVLLSPKDGHVVAKGDQVVLLAQQQRDCKPDFGLGGGGAAAASADADADAAARPKSAAVAMPKPKPKKLLVLNWNPRMPHLLEQIDEVSAPGTSITLVADEDAGAMPSAARLRNCRLDVRRDDPTSADVLEDAKLASQDSVLVLQSGEGGEAQDAYTLACTLAIEEAMRRAGVEGADGPRLVGEVLDPRMEELISSRFAGVVDLVLPTELASGTLVQFALQPELNGVYSQLLTTEGKELVLQPPALYQRDGDDLEQLSFATIYQRARERGEVALGVLRDGVELPELNPAKKNVALKLRPTDQLVVVGDAD